MKSEDQLISLINATKVLTSTRNLDEVLHLLIEEVLSVFSWADASVLFMHDSRTNILKAKSAVGFKMEYIKDIALEVNEGMSGKTFKLKNAQLYTSSMDTSIGMSNLSEINRELYNKSLKEDYKVTTSTISAPLINNKKCVGVLTIDSFSEKVEFTDDNLELLQTFANQAMIAIENATLISQNTRSQHIHNELTKVYMSQSGLQGITKTLSKLINKPIYVTNEFYDILTCTTEFYKDIIQQIGGNERIHIDELFDEERTESILITDEWLFKDVYCFFIKIGKALAGALFIINDKDEALDPLDLFAIEQATTVFALDLQSMNQFTSNEFNHETYLMKKILNNPLNGETYLKNKGFHMDQRNFVVLTIDMMEEQIDSEELSKVSQKLTNILYQNLSGYQYLVYMNETQYTLFLSMNNNITYKETEKLLIRLVKKVRRRLDLKILAGLGRSFNKISQIAESLNDSYNCIGYLKMIKKDLYFITYMDLGEAKLFLNIDINKLESFISTHIKNMLDYDQKNKTELISTLKMYLYCNNNIRKTSGMMYVHENTVKYRINKIKKIMNLKEFNGDTNFELNLSLKIYDYLNRINLSK